jgi:hypothetical protein
VQPPGTTCVTKARPNNRGTLRIGRDTSPVERLDPTIGIPPLQLIDRFDHRITTARTLEQLAAIAAEIAQTRKALERSGMIVKPVPGDKAVRDAVRESITDQLGVLEKIIFAGAWEGATEMDLSAGVLAAFKKACWEAAKAEIEERWGKFAKDAAEAAKSHRPKDILKAGADAGAALAKSFSDKDGFMRKVLKIMRKEGIFIDEKKMEYGLRKLLEKKLASLSEGISTIAKIFTNPVYVFFKVLLTPSRVASDAEEDYSAFDDLTRRLQNRYEQLAPPLPLSEPLSRIRIDAEPGPVIRARP